MIILYYLYNHITHKYVRAYMYVWAHTTTTTTHTLTWNITHHTHKHTLTHTRVYIWILKTIKNTQEIISSVPKKNWRSAIFEKQTDILQRGYFAPKNTIIYRVLIKYCVFSLKCCDFFLTLPVLLQRWCSSCHLVVQARSLVYTPRRNRERHFKIFEKKTQYIMNTLYYA